jgi:hypothetical protein
MLQQRKIDYMIITNSVCHPGIIINRLQKIFRHIQFNVPVIFASGLIFYLKEDHKQIDTGVVQQELK